MNLPTADKIKQTGATCLEKLEQWILTNFCDDSSRWDCSFIYISRTFEARTRANITGFDLWHEFHCRKAVFKASGTTFSGREAALLATKSYEAIWQFYSLLKKKQTSSRVRIIGTLFFKADFEISGLTSEANCKSTTFFTDSSASQIL